MEIAHCRYFLALCQEGNFTRAAKRCGVAQPSLTRAIRKLERELGEPLFVRRHERTNLTPFGWEVFPYFDAIARCVTEIKRRPQGISTADCKAANEIVRMLHLASWTTVPSTSVLARASKPADQQVSIDE
jgi:molybdenum-dependent DNA-binding transcriptional regulator ModE